MKTVKKEILIHAPAAKVWEHLTDPAKVGTWFKPCDIAARVGHQFTLASECSGDLHSVVREVIPNRKLAYTFPLAKFKIETLVTFLLEETGGVTKLTLLHTGFEQLTAEQIAETTSMYDGGWGTFLPRLQAQAAEPTLAVAQT
jgi:uncharacterized protein YndB with AHSA1/START domain